MFRYYELIVVARYILKKKLDQKSQRSALEHRLSQTWVTAKRSDCLTSKLLVA